MTETWSTGSESATHTTSPDGSDAIVREPALTGRLVAGSNHTRKLSADNAAYCWGGNGQGQVGIGALSPRVQQPAAVATALRFVRLAAGSSHTTGPLGGLRAIPRIVVDPQPSARNGETEPP